MLKHYIHQVAYGFQWKIVLSIIGTIFAVINNFYGILLWGFIGLFCLDLITGILKSLINHIPISSARLRDSVVKFGAYIFVITALIITSKFQKSFVAVTTTGYYYFMFTELKSILENCGAMGIKIPSALLQEVTNNTGTSVSIKENPRERIVEQKIYETEKHPGDNKIVKTATRKRVIIIRNKEDK